MAKMMVINNHWKSRLGVLFWRWGVFRMFWGMCSGKKWIRMSQGCQVGKWVRKWEKSPTFLSFTARKKDVDHAWPKRKTDGTFHCQSFSLKMLEWVGIFDTTAQGCWLYYPMSTSSWFVHGMIFNMPWSLYLHGPQWDTCDISACSQVKYPRLGESQKKAMPQFLAISSKINHDTLVN